MEAGAYTSPFWASQLPGAPNFSLTRLDGILMTPLNLLIHVQLLWSPSGSHCTPWSRLLSVYGPRAKVFRQYQGPPYPGKHAFSLLLSSL